MNQQSHGTDPKIIVALISGFVSITVTMIPLLNASERNLFLILFLSAALLVLVSVGLFLLIRQRRFKLLAVLILFAALFAVSVLLARGLVPMPPRLNYTGAEVMVYAGTGDRTSVDGSLEECSFVSPRSLSVWGDALYMTDSDKIRCLESGKVWTLAFPANRYNALVVRSHDGDVYVLGSTRRQAGKDGKYYTAFLRLRNGETEILSEPLEMGAFSGSVPDFAFSSGGVLWFIRLYHAPGQSTATLEKLPYDRDTGTYGPPEWVMDLPYAASDMRDARMVFDRRDNLYLSVPGQGVILELRSGELNFRIFAGTEGERVSNDRSQVTFSYPTSLVADGDALLVMDNGVIRRVTRDGDRSVKSVTLAGVTPEKVNDPDTNVRYATVGDIVAGNEAAFSSNEQASLIRDGWGRLLVSDPENSFLYEITEDTGAAETRPERHRKMYR